MEYRVDWVAKYGKMGEKKNTHYGNSSVTCTGTS